MDRDDAIHQDTLHYWFSVMLNRQTASSLTAAEIHENGKQDDCFTAKLLACQRRNSDSAIFTIDLLGTWDAENSAAAEQEAGHCLHAQRNRPQMFFPG